MLIQAAIITYGRTDWLSRCLSSLKAAAARCPELQFEVLVGVNGRDEASERLLRELSVPFEVIERTTPAAARNRLFPRLKGDWVLFIDDDAFVEGDYFEVFRAIRSVFAEAAAIGGPNLTHQASTDFQRAAGEVLASRFATFLSYARYAPIGAPRSCDDASLILCNLFVRRSELKELKFPEHIVSAEENWLLARLKKDGAQLVYAPTLWVWHERRGSLVSLTTQVFKYGRGRGQSLVLQPWTLRPSHVLPTLCLLYTLVLAAAALTGQVTSPAWFVAHPLYAALCVWFAATRTHHFLTALLLFPLIHVSYGIGILCGLVAGRRDP